MDDRIIAAPDEFADIFPFDGNFVSIPGVVLHPRGLANAVIERLRGVNQWVVRQVIQAVWDVMAEALLAGRPVVLRRIGLLRPALRCNRFFGHAWAELRFHASPWMRRALKREYPRLMRLAEQVHVGTGPGEFTPVDEGVADVDEEEGGDGDAL